ncbi:hypothetical protein HELRODRAFT_68059, partial [Helobdella robusta]|uniref:UDENN domain-containing protein n=1 Tax=Helobdella robusta TaxID=6412 RepID=T1FZ97_HELRO
MDDKRVADYFVVAGLDWNVQPLAPLEEVFPNETSLKSTPTQRQDPIVDLAVIDRTLGEPIPTNFRCIEFTPTNFPADLNHGSLRAHEMYLCYRRGRDKPAILDIGVTYENKDCKEKLLPGCEVIYWTPQANSANVNNGSGSLKIFVTFRRSSTFAPIDILVVTEICVILPNKGETAPHAHCMIDKNLNKGIMGSDVFLCYKKSMAKLNCLTFKPSLLGHYPLEDIPQLPLPQQVAMFCLPMGATLESWSPQRQFPTPVFSTFILTTGLAAEKVYGAAVTFYEKLAPDKLKLLDQAQRSGLGIEKEAMNGSAGEDYGANKSICLLSRLPFFETFKKFLLYIYRMVFGRVDDLSQYIPIERHISHFLTRIPLPSIQRPRIMIQLSSTSILLTQPDETPLPKSGASFIDVLKNLGPTNSTLLLLSVLMEHKILVHSLRPAVLTSVSEAISAMIFPLHWQCPYIPLCPIGLSYVLHSPTPFIIGIDSRYFDTYDLPSDVTCIDLDTKTFTVSEDRRSHNIKLLPKKPAKLLRSTLEKLNNQLLASTSLSSPQSLIPSKSRSASNTFSLDDSFNVALEISIREAYLRFMAAILKGYSGHLLPITNAPSVGNMSLNSLFDVVGFVKSRDKAYNKFYALLLKTQAFSRFIEERSFVSDKDSSLAFFDDCLERVDDCGNVVIKSSSGSQSRDFTNPPSATTPFQNRVNHRHQQSGSTTATSSADQVKVGAKFAGYSSPMVCRTHHEIKQSQKFGLKYASVPQAWAKYLAWHCYSLWFIHLSSYARYVHSKSKVLKSAFDVLVSMQSARLQPPDEVCYRVLMQLCGIYHQPVLAVKVLFEMKKRGIQPNAITYGFYNKAVLESKWPTSNSTPDQLWNKLRNVLMAVARFKR